MKRVFIVLLSIFLSCTIGAITLLLLPDNQHKYDSKIYKLEELQPMHADSKEEIMGRMVLISYKIKEIEAQKSNL